MALFLTVKFSNNVEKYINREIDSLTVEKIHTKSCKYVLGVRNSSSNDGCRGELGRLPILYSIFLNLVKYWCHLVKDLVNKNILVKEACNTSTYLLNTNKESWVGCIKELLNYLRLEYLFQKPENFKTNNIVSRGEYHQ